MEKTWKEILGSKWDGLMKLKRESTDPYVKDLDVQNAIYKILIM